MARNEEKAQSMLYRFREAQAAELGLGTRADRRPKMASACKSMRECERWRGEILREISRKVSKIQDTGLTDYEVRDLNDEINKLLREKRHWENQIIALGGANYRRNVAMLDDDGKEVPGTKGYKYFGRAKDLPGVRELFQGKKKEEEEESQAFAYYKKFMGQGPAYYGDLDETQGPDGILGYERAAEEAEWRNAHLRIREMLSLPLADPIPAVPQGTSDPPSIPSSDPSASSSSSSNAKRKALQTGDINSVADTTAGQSKQGGSTSVSKRSKMDSSNSDALSEIPIVDPSQPEAHTAKLHTYAEITASFIPFLTAKALMPPTFPSKTDMEEVLLRLRKEALVQEFFGVEGAAP
ncbi:Isy1-like splicing factor [Scleroderma yunnanense]